MTGMSIERHIVGKTRTIGSGIRQPSSSVRTPATPRPLLLNVGQRLGNIGLGRVLQAKLTVSQPDDLYEQEADRIADTVIRMPMPPSQTVGEAGDAQPEPGCCGREVQRQPLDEEEPLQTKQPVGFRRIQRQAPLEQEEESLQTQALGAHEALARQALPDEEEPLQRRGDGTGGGQVSTEVEDAIHGLAGRGAPLGEPVRDFMEPRFGADFSAVRVHTDAAAQLLARAVSAQAFTVGRNVVFGAGQYAPDTSSGRRLIAHELTHVVQQGAASQAMARPDSAPLDHEEG
jgi:hypothetical protein